MLTEVRPQYPATIWIGYLNLTTGAVIADPEKRWAGRMDVPRINEGGDTSTIQISVESKLIDLQRARARYYTHQDQQIDYPGDNGFAYVNGIQDLGSVWGRPGSPINNLPPAFTIAAPPPNPGPPARPNRFANPWPMI